MGDTFELTNDSGVVTFGGGIADPGATSGDVLTVQDDGTIAAEAGDGGIPDPVTDTVVITPTDPTHVGLQVKPAAGASADFTDEIEWYDDAGNLIGYIDAAGGFVHKVGASGSFQISDSTDTIALAVCDDGDNVRLGNSGNTLSFFGATPVAQQEVTGALSSVLDTNAQDVLTSIIATLVNLGLATDGTT